MISRNLTVTALVATAFFSVSTAFAQAPAAPAAPAAAVAPKAVPVNAAPAVPAAPAAVPAVPASASKAAPAAKAEKKAPNKQFTAQTAKSKECSVKADEKKLKGKARQKFRAECKKAA